MAREELNWSMFIIFASRLAGSDEIGEEGEMDGSMKG